MSEGSVRKAKFHKATYFPIGRHWKKLKPIYQSQEAYNIWFPNMVEFYIQKMEENGFKRKISRSRFQLPRDFDSCDWRFGRRGRSPGFWDYTCHSACHWLVDVNLFAAQKLIPEVPWRVVSARHHSTIWNGDTESPVVFDLNFLAMGVDAPEALKIASKWKQCKPGERLRNPSLKGVKIHE